MTRTAQPSTERTVPENPLSPSLELSHHRAVARMIARIVYRAPQMKMNGCCLLRWMIRSPVDSNPSA